FLAELHQLMIEADIPGRDLPPPGEAFPGWEMIAPMLRPRNGSVFSLVEKPLILWDEPEQVRGAARRHRTRLEQIETSAAYDPERVFFRWEEIEQQTAACPQLVFQQLDLGWNPAGPEAAAHISTRPSLSFHGNMQVAIAEARTIVEEGRRVA